MRTCRYEAIVLGVMEYREADKIVTLFTAEHGKLRGVARGAKRSVRRFGGALELFAHLHIELVVHEGLSNIHGADIVTIYPRIRKDLAKIGYASYACEAIDRLTPDGMANPRLFRLLAAYLEHLDTALPSASARRFFEVNLLNILGYRPALEHCCSCGADLLGEHAPAFLAASGNLLCGRCGRGGRPVSAATVALLDRSLQIGRFGVITFAPDELVEAGNLLDAAIASHLTRPLKSLSFLRELGE